uniref:Uncharacterized protein MANES_S106600 n=1 Tax=Rhizophora mucronata TaxID=61149 RepID=A0A2P2L9T1_RHIMU
MQLFRFTAELKIDKCQLTLQMISLNSIIVCFTLSLSALMWGKCVGRS